MGTPYINGVEEVEDDYKWWVLQRWCEEQGDLAKEASNWVDEKYDILRDISGASDRVKYAIPMAIQHAKIWNTILNRFLAKLLSDIDISMD